MGTTVDGRADLYALGVVIYEMLAGKLPFVHEKMSEIQHMHLEVTPPRLPGPLGDVIWRCMQKRPEDRHASARELERALCRTLDYDTGPLRAVA